MTTPGSEKKVTKHLVQKVVEPQELPDESKNKNNTSKENSSAKRLKKRVAIVRDLIISEIREDLLTTNKHKVNTA